MSRKLIVVIAPLLFACGNSSSPPLDLALNKTWIGTSNYTISGASAGSFNGGLVIAVNGDSALVSNVCIGGSGSLTVTGSGDTASFSGTFNCPAYPLFGCSPQVVISYTSATLTLTTGMLPAEVSFVATGTTPASTLGCNSAAPFVLTFRGD